MQFLQSTVLPIVKLRRQDDNASIVKCYGTCFQVNRQGFALTASHVIQTALADRDKDDWIGIVGKGGDGSTADNRASPVLRWASAPSPYDVAIIETFYGSPTRFRLAESTSTSWQDVASYGYPESAIVKDKDALWMHLRCFKGYIHRSLDEDGGPRAYELSFPIGSGQSGSPVFVHAGETDTVIGVCVGTVRSEIKLDIFTEVRDDNSEYREVTSKIEEYGIAHDLTALADWKPDGFDGRTLRELFEAG